MSKGGQSGIPSPTSASSAAGVAAACCVAVAVPEVSRPFVAVAADFAGKVVQRVAWAVVVTVTVTATSVVGMSSITTLGVCQTMRRLFWGLVVSAVGGVKMLRGLGWSCPVGVGKASGVVRN